MKTGIVGAGAMGSLFAWYFAEAGIETVIYEKSEPAVLALSQGLTVTAAGADTVIHPAVSSDPSILSVADIIFIFVKSYSTDEAARLVSSAAETGAVIVSLQNGLGNYDTLCRHFTGGRIVYGTTTLGASKSSPAHVVFGGSGTVNIGGQSSSSVETARSLLESAAVDVHVTPDPEKAVWMKALINAGINPVAAILGIKNGEILEIPHAMELQSLITSEAVACSKTRGLDFDFQSVLEETREVCRKTASNTCSMLQDIRAGRKTEIESINMKIAEYGEAAGLDMRCNRTISLLIKALEESNRPL